MTHLKYIKRCLRPGGVGKKHLFALVCWDDGLWSVECKQQPTTKRFIFPKDATKNFLKEYKQRRQGENYEN
jgi:hypothetical protein